MEETYARIKQNEYQIPLRVSKSASMLIRSLLHANPDMRPTMFTILDHEFFREYTPNCLPVSCLTTYPRFDTLVRHPTGRRPLSDINPIEDIPITSGGGYRANFGPPVDKAIEPDDCWLSELQKRVSFSLPHSISYSFS